ncbi:MAG: AIPR family protein [Candidatus Micrarchaeia archaeon]
MEIKENLRERLQDDPQKILEFFIELLKMRLRDHQFELHWDITDGPNDGGLDAYLVDPVEKTIYLVQCKWHTSGSETLTRDESLALYNFYDLYLLQDRKDGLHERVARFITNYNKLWKKYKLRFIYLSPRKPLPEAVEKYITIGEFSRYGLDELAKDFELVLSEEEKIQNRIVFSLPAGFLLRSISYPLPAGTVTVKTLLGTTRGIDLKLAFDKYGWELLQRNLRFELKGKINEGMKTTAESEERTAFLILHNGISIVCEKFLIFDGIINWEEKGISLDEDEKKEFESYINDSLSKGIKNFVFLENFQIVNGGQTYATLSRIDKVKLEDIEIPVRITQTADSTLVSRIAVCNNSQNRIVPWDLVANSKEQIFLQNYAAKQDPPIFYQRKRGEKWGQVEFLTGSRPPKERTIFCKKAFQAFASFEGLPGPAYARTEKLLDPNGQIYKGIAESDADLILMAGLLLNYESKARAKKEPEFTKYWEQWAIAAFGHLYDSLNAQEKKCLKRNLLSENGLKCWKSIREYLKEMFSEFLSHFEKSVREQPQSIFKDVEKAWEGFNARRANISPRDIHRYIDSQLRAKTFEEMRRKEGDKYKLGYYTVNFAILASFIDSYDRRNPFKEFLEKKGLI